MRGETIYSLPSRVTAQADTFSIEALASYRCPGKHVPCVPRMVKLSFEFIPSKRVRIPMPRTARTVIDGTSYAVGQVIYGDVHTTPYEQREWRPPYTFEVFVHQDRFAEMAEASSVLMDFGGFSFKLSDRVLSGFRRMSREMPGGTVEEAVEEEPPEGSDTMVITPED